MYLKFLPVNGYRSCLLKNHVSILHHYFALFNWPTRALHARQVTVLVKSVQINVKLHVRVKGVFALELLASVSKFQLAKVYKALFLTSFLEFFLQLLFPPLVVLTLTDLGFHALGM